MGPASRVRARVRALGPTQVALLLGALAALVGIVKYGLVMWAGWPNLLEVAQNWKDPTAGPLVQPPQDYILANAAPSALIGMLGVTVPFAYVTLQVLLALLAIMLPFTMPVVRSSAEVSRLVFVMLAGGPVLALLLTWIGGYDTLCILGATIGVLARRSPIAGIGWSLFAIGHSTIALLAFMLWSTWLLLTSVTGARRGAWVRVAWGFSGVVAGSVITGVLVASWGGVTSRLEVYRLYPIDYYVNALIAGMPMILFSALGVGWIVLLDSRVRRSRAALLITGSALLLSFVLPVLALDQTRTIALVTFPLVLAWAAAVPGLYPDGTPRRLWSRYAVASAIVPIVIVGTGEWMSSGWQSLLAWRSTF